MDLDESHRNFPSCLMYIGFKKNHGSKGYIYIGFKKNHGLKGYIASACFNLLALFYDFG